METEFPDLPHVRQNLFTDQTVGLLITIHGDLHLYIDRNHAKKIATGLPVNKPLWGAVDALGSCTKVKSDILSGKLQNAMCCIFIPGECTQHHTAYTVIYLQFGRKCGTITTLWPWR